VGSQQVELRPDREPTVGDSRLQGVLKDICTDAATDNMTLNIIKCATMQFFFGKASPPPPLLTPNGEQVLFVKSMTLLGVTLDSSMKWDTHVANTVSKANSKRYLIVVLKRAGVGVEHLLKFYTTYVRPTLDYAAPVWHPGISAQLSDRLESVQRSSLRTIFPDLSYNRALAATGLPTLHDRRDALCLSFGNKTHSNPDFAHWFPAKRQDCHRHNLRNKNQITMPHCRTQRLKNSPVNFLISLMNRTAL
jgi:hypothetical protein